MVDGVLDRRVAAGSAEGRLAEIGRTGGAPPRLGDRSARTHTRLALEIARNRERGHRAIEGELATSERAWRGADEIAAVADRRAPPGRVERACGRLRGRGDVA